ncbi:facilitated trehalose transporter Tret1-like [Choristoneura fumiferana]|uniref:facilitated trehalose transporter Tret1-like n=1 Tax=Choristoneura fumiferana TaxID=7141 RepID=UPI003D158320
MERLQSPLVNQIFVASGVLSTILSCGLGLGYLAAFLDQGLLHDNMKHYVDSSSLHFIETAGEVAFVPSILIIPYTMQKKGRRIASIATVLPLLFSWLISFDVKHFSSLLLVNILHNISLGGAATISSIIISETCSPKHRGTFLMLETAMISLGVLLSHVSGIYSAWRLISALGLLSAFYGLLISYLSPESPYWLISQGYTVKCVENFHWLRGRDQEASKELKDLLVTYKIQIQLEALKPIRKLGIRERVLDYLRSLIKVDFLKPLSIMILLFSFVGFGGENFVSNSSFRNIFKLTNGKYIGTIVLDVLALVCSLTACVLMQVVRRKSLFLFTGSCSILFLGFTTLFLILQSIHLFSKDYLWLFLTVVTGFSMFMSLGTTALPFSLLGEIFPMSYKGVGSSLTCAYLWAFGNTILKLVPTLTGVMGINSILCLATLFMIFILVIVNKILPETGMKTLVEIENLMKTDGSDYDTVALTDQEDNSHFDRLQLFLEV